MRQERRRQRIAAAAGVDPERVVRSWVVAPFVRSDPRYVRRPVFRPRPEDRTLRWDRSAVVPVASPESVAWYGLLAVTRAQWLEVRVASEPSRRPGAGNDGSGAGGPDGSRGVDRALALVYGQVAQLAAEWAFDRSRGRLRVRDSEAEDEGQLWVAARYDAATRATTGGVAGPRAHLVALAFLAALARFAEQGWYGYAGVDPVLGPRRLRGLADAVARAVFDRFPPADVFFLGRPRDLGVGLAAVARHAGATRSEALAGAGRRWLDRAANLVALLLGPDGQVAPGGAHQAATQAVVARGLLAASQVSGVSETETARLALSYLFDELWDPYARTFAGGEDAATVRVTPQTAGDVIGGLNTADMLGVSRARERFAAYLRGTVERGGLQRAERLPSLDADEEHPLPFPAGAGGPHGAAPVFDAAVTYDRRADEWTTTDDAFVAAGACYAATQCAWIGARDGVRFPGRGLPGAVRGPPADGRDAGRCRTPASRAPGTLVLRQ